MEEKCEKEILDSLNSHDIHDMMYKNKKRIIDEISKWSFYKGDIFVYSTLFALMNTNNSNLKPFNVISCSKQGTGKTRSSVGLVKKLKLPAVIFTGWITPKRFYTFLKENRKKMIIFDESDLILNNKSTAFLLKSALYGSREVSWISDKDPYDSFKMEGNIVFSTNTLVDKSANEKAMLDRVYLNHMDLSNVETVEMIHTINKYKKGITKDDDEVWNIIRNRLILIRNGKVDVKLSEEEENLLLDYISKGILSYGKGYNPDISTRIYERVSEIFLRFKMLFGFLDKDIIELCKKMCDNYFVMGKKDENIILDIVKENKGVMTIKELSEIISKRMYITQRQAQRKIKDMVERGILERPNRLKVVMR